MKTYTRILGIVSFITCLGILGLWIFGFIQLIEEKPESLWILIPFAIPLYTLIHFVILHRFGFNYKAEYTKPQKVSIVVLAILFASIFIFILPLGVKKFHRAVTLGKELSKAVHWKSDTTAYGYIGSLTTKHIDGKILYQFQVRSEKEFKANLTGFSIKFLDEDGFFIKELSISGYSQSVDSEGKTFGYRSNSNKYFSSDDYRRIADWDLFVTTK